MHTKLSRSSAMLARGVALGILVSTLWASCKREHEEAPAAEPAPAAASAAADHAAAPAPEAAQDTTPQAAQEATADTAPGAPATAAASGPTLDKPLLWEVRRGEAVSHLLGTVHVEYRMDQLPAAVLDRLDAASTLVVETDATAISIPAMMQRAMLPPDQSLRAMLGDEHWGRLVAELGSSLPPPALERMQPWIIVALLALGDKDMTDPSQVMDVQILQRARSQNKREVLLEEPGEQLDVLIETGDLEVLKEMLDDMDRVRSMLAEQLAAYGRGDFEALSKAILDPEEMRKRPAYYEKLIFARNRAWMGELKKVLAEGGAFVAVGAGHFPGEQGLLALLRKAGYEVRRIEP